MPPKKQWHCPHCGQPFSTERAMHTHVGMVHEKQLWAWALASKPEQKQKRRRCQVEGPAPRPPPPPFPGPFVAVPGEDGGVAEAACPAAMVQDAPAGAPGPGPLAKEREEARRLLRTPGVERWAEETLAWCEENILRDVGAIFPTAEDFPTRETYRFLQVFHSNPGTGWGQALLQANQEEHLDLSKVRIWGWHNAHLCSNVSVYAAICWYMLAYAGT